MIGKVWLTGAGPNDVELLTIKAKKVIEQAQVVVYDSLVGDGVLALIPQDAQVIDVGKRSGDHKMKQEEINQLLVDLAKEGKRVVRLKGGDPFLFGRGGEEGELLAKNQIPFEVIPGVTSAIAVPAYEGIPVTHRDCASMIHIITGHKKEKVESGLNFKALVEAGGTYVFLMGISAIPDISTGLLAADLDPNTPCAILSQGTSAFAKKYKSTISKVETFVKENKIKTPGIFLVGEVCDYDDRLDWRKALPLNGKKYFITRPRERGSVLADKLRQFGAEVIELPSIVTKRIVPNNEFVQLLETISEYSMIAFTSPAGVEYFFDGLIEAEKDIRCLSKAKFVVIGKGTKNELKKYGILADYMPETYDGDALGRFITQIADKGEKILIPRATEGNPKLVQEMRRRTDIQITDFPIYETLLQEEKVLNLEERIKQQQITDVIFTSASTVKGFLAQVKGNDVTKIRAYCIGKMTGEEAKKAGMHCLMAKEATMDALAELILQEKDQQAQENNNGNNP